MGLGIGIAVLAVGWLIGYLGGLGKRDKLETQLNNTRRANYHLQEDVKLLKAENK